MFLARVWSWLVLRFCGSSVVTSAGHAVVMAVAAAAPLGVGVLLVEDLAQAPAPRASMAARAVSLVGKRGEYMRCLSFPLYATTWMRRMLRDIRRWGPPSVGVERLPAPRDRPRRVRVRPVPGAGSTLS